LSQKIVCSGGKLRKSSQVLYRSDQGKYFLKIKLFCPHLSRVKMNSVYCTVSLIECAKMCYYSTIRGQTDTKGRSRGSPVLHCPLMD